MNRPHFRFLSGVVMVVTVLAMGVPKPARGGRLIVTNVPLKFLIAVTFAMADPQSLINSRILGGPDWIDSERYDISARANTEFQVSPDGPSSEMLLMIHSLLQERFKLVAHRETRELPIYELVVARADGRLGPGLHKSDVDCVALTAARQAGATPPPRQPNAPPPCGLMGGPARTIAGGRRCGSSPPICPSLWNGSSSTRPV